MAVIDGKTYVARGGEVYESVPETLTDRAQIRAMLRRTRDQISALNVDIANVRARKAVIVARRDALKLLIDASGGE